MPEIQWTKNQIRAITENAPRVLVSAAAGSGKTTVLTERIIRRLSDSENPMDLSQILVVTFTKAATADLKEQISSALSKALSENPSSVHLSRQLTMLPSAQISTIHSFCYHLIRLYFQQLHLPSSLRIADENEGRLLAFEVMDRLLEDLYEENDRDSTVLGFSQLVDQFVSIDDGNLGKMFLSIYDRIVSLPNGIQEIAKTAERYDACRDGSYLESAWGQAVLDDVFDAVRYFSLPLKAAVEYLPQDEVAEKKYGETFRNDLDALSRIEALYHQKDYAGVVEMTKTYRAVKIKSTKYPDPPLCISDGVIAHAQMKDFFDRLLKKCYFPEEQQMSSAAQICAQILRSLAALLEEFDRRFRQEKIRRGILDYNDLERYTLQLLVDADGKPTQTAYAVSSQYREIYIDEYQDVNQMQDMIFSAVSVSCQRFMVGDIKQSIYAFRGSAPHLFAQYRKDTAYQTVFLSENFRSDRPIIGFCNAVFDVLFRHTGSEMPYEDSDSLVCGKSKEKQKDIACTLAVLPNKSADSDASQVEEDELLPEPRYVASRIRDLVQSGEYLPCDIVILLRSPSTGALAYEQALQEVNISCVNKDKQSLLENEEVLLLLSLLRVIDNPRRDIDLAAVLRSPMFGLSMDDLIRIRKNREGCLYEALCDYSQEENFLKGRYFLKKMKEYRKMAIASPVDRLIWFLMEDTAIGAFRISEDPSDGVAGRANLLMFYDYARQFESGSFQGLSNFLRYINGILDSDSAGKFRSPESKGEGRDTVRIMSIHASKGLQFPVCFVCGTGQSINDRDSTGNLLLDRELGISMKLTDETGFLHYETPFRLACARVIHNRAVSEEMRILYVALTRAKERLIITGSVADPEELIDHCSCASRNLPKDCRYPFTEGKPSYLRWMLIALYASEYRDYTFLLPDVNPAADGSSVLQENKLLASPNPEKIRQLFEEINKRYSFSYPFAALSSIPAKVTVSQLHPNMLASDENSLALSALPTEFITPRFLEGTKFSAAERGTATHQFMQFCNLEHLEPDCIEDEIERLTDRGFLTPRIAELIDRRALKVFFTSGLCRQMKSAAELRREIRFNTKFPATLFLQEPSNNEALCAEEILVQGVIDCYFIDKNGRCVLVDYKTDRLPREILGSVKEEDAFLANRHLSQLRYYRIALEKMLCHNVDKVLLWSFSLGREVDLTSLCADFSGSDTESQYKQR